MRPDRYQRRLLTQAIDGDAAAFSSLQNRYLDACYRYFYFRVGSVAVAEQLTDRLFIHAWEILPYERELSHLPFKLWLLRLANQVIADYKDFLAGPEAAAADERPPLVAWSLETESSKLPTLHPRFLALAIRKLTPVAQQVVVLRFLLALSPEEVALVIDDTVQGAYALQYRALTTLCGVLTRRQIADDLFSGEYIESTNFCLDHIVSGTRTVEGCLEHLADYNDQLQETLQFGQMVANTRHLHPRRVFQHDARARITWQISNSRRSPIEQSRRASLFGVQLLRRVSPAVLLIAGVLLLLAPLSLYAVGAIDRLTPTSRAYRLDLGLEQLYLAALRDPQKITRYRLTLTQERLLEAEVLVREGDLRGLQTALLAYMLQVSTLSQELSLAQSDVPAETVDAAFSEQEQQLTAILEMALPPDVQVQPASLSCTQPTASATGHPTALALVAQSGAEQQELHDQLCNGYTFGEIVLALATRAALGAGPGAADQSLSISTGDTLQLKQKAGGWGYLWYGMGDYP